VLVTTVRRGGAPRPADYVFVDWGPEFAAQHALAFPELSSAGVFAGLGPLGREYLLAAGGSAYIRSSVVRAHLESGRLRRVPGAPEFLYPAYAVYSANADLKVVTPALAGLKHVAVSEARPAAKARRGRRSDRQ
jgi:hypothetical protein